MKTRICFLLATGLIHISAAQTDPVVLAVQKAVPAVVNISTEQIIERFGRDPFEELFRQFMGQHRHGVVSLGSGVMVDTDGWIVTNYHVVRRASKITVTLVDGTMTEARFVSGDEKNDLALLKMDSPKPLPYLELDGDGEVMLGETVIAIGNPFGFDHTVTRGIVSAKNRKFPPDDPKFEDVLQTDAAINPGNSGGPLINMRGELVGINTAILSQAEGIGFAIPAKRVANLLTVWFSPEKRARLWLGLRFTREEDQIVVTDVQPGSPAAKAGVQSRQVIRDVDGRRFADVLKLQRYMMHKKPGDEVRLNTGERKPVVVQLAALPQVSAPELMQQRFGVSVQTLTDDLAGALGMSSAQGLLVTEVQRDSPGTEAGLRRGMVVTHFAGEEVESMDRLAEQLADVKAGDTVSLVVFVSERRGNYTLQQTGKVTLKAR